MKKTMIYLPDELHRWLVREAEGRGTSMAALVREAVSEYRVGGSAEEPRGIAAFIGLIDDPDGPTDVSERVDEYLAEYYREGGQWDQEHGFAPHHAESESRRRPDPGEAESPPDEGGHS